MLNPILITGAAGFIGFHTAKKLLESGLSVVGIDNMNDYYDVQLKEDRLNLLSTYDNFEFVKLDISDRAAMENLWQGHGPFTKVIHLAAQAGVRYSLQNPYDYISSNIMGHLVILEMCRHTKGFEHLVYASSSSVYGKNKKLPYSVDDPVDHPISLYAATKKSDELISHSYSHLYGIPQTGLRFFTVYGPWGRPDMAYFIFTKAISEGKKVPVFNNGNMKRDFTYIDDIVDGILLTLERPPVKAGVAAPCRVLNLGNHKSEDLMDFIHEIEDALNKKADIEFKPMQPGDVIETFADVDETIAITGYHPKTTISQGLPIFVEWYKSYCQIGSD
ncbi:MAG: SDR family NAD(P)-dependent oxidoreductase [Alphaproteobacteria bacterium]|jgi:UDP-glucuronate 4-epimerase|nr:hypothetical protein [Alphaproteobacteria bacterium]MCS5597598.1 SDR family NAD(P)-dependent oxidoreductase [Alphaproteobacteria bacterium]|tara:strand:+ start:12888 stop:13883 length:996 start_codon:yes stop_codon:yes gene_type:complete